MLEADIQADIRVALSEYGVVLRLNHGQFWTKDGRPVRSGLPNGVSDLLFVGQGYVAWLELKRPGEEPRKDQRAFLERMRGLGHRAGVARSVEDALRIIGIGA